MAGAANRRFPPAEQFPMFSLGRPILALTVVAALGGVWVASRPPSVRAPLELWTFAEPHARMYEEIRSGSDARQDALRPLGETKVRLLPNNALNIRLVSLFMADRRGGELPDVVEIRQDALGRYLNAPADQIPFHPLNGFLESGPNPWFGRIVPERFAPYTRDGQIFGLPRDVHPVGIAYRADFFAEAGINLDEPTPGKTYLTWPDFHERCLRFQTYWRARGVHDRWAIDLLAGNAEMLTALLLQRGVNLIEADGRVMLTDPVVIDTIAFYARLVAGSARISSDATAAGVGALRRDLASGLVCATLAPDWRVADLRESPELTGKLRLARLPRFADADAPTTTWGGTMVAIPRHCRDPNAAWQLIQSVYLSDAGMTAQASQLGILPAAPEFWSNQAVRRPDPFFGGQSAGTFYADLAAHIPRQHLAPETTFASAALGYVLSQATGAVRDGASDAELKTRLQGWLAARQFDVERQIANGRR